MRFTMTIFGLTILLAGCATTMNNYYQQTVQSWRGGSVNQLVKQWGRPDRVATGPKGNTLYVYETQNYRTVSGPTYPAVGVHVGSDGRPVMTTSPATNMAWNRGSMSISCVAAFETDPSGKILNTEVQGSNCYGGESFAKRLSNKNAPLPKSGG